MSNISDISAVSGLTNLTGLGLGYNNISDISAVSGLTNLTGLALEGNNISDISAVSGLTNLTSLYLWSNSIRDISAVSGLTNLTSLELWRNSIRDISAVSGLTNLTSLELWRNSIRDISAVSGLTNLTSLELSHNSITDLSPLVANTGLGEEDEVDVRVNPLSYQSIHTHIPALQGRGVTVEFDNRTATTLFNISGAITASNNTLIVEVRDSDRRTFEGVPVIFTVTSGGGTLSVTNTTTDEKGRAESTIALGRESNRVKVSAVGVEQTVTFSDVAAGVHIADPNLRAAIEGALGLAPGSPISPADMATLTYLRAYNDAIGVLTGLEFATNLTELDLYYNSISDLSPLSGLTNLTSLYLSSNSIRDISAVSGLTNLTSLYLWSNSIRDISAVSGLTNLTALGLRDNSITDISAVSGLTNLITLRLSGNRVTDISPLSGLTNLRNLGLPRVIQDLPARLRILLRLPHLTSLGISSNSIEDVSVLIPVLSALTDLTRLDLGNNAIRDISALAGLTNLTNLNLRNNNITDISPLAELTNLTDLDLWDNNIRDISALAGLTNLTNLNLRNNNIRDILPLAELTNLTDLDLDSNNITDILPLAELTNLTDLDLDSNNITDILPLVENTGLGSQGRSYVVIWGNPLSYQSIHTHIPILQSRGVWVYFDDQAHPALSIISGGNQRRLPGETLASPFVVEAQDENGSPFAGVSVTFTVTEGDGTLSIQTTTTDANGRAESTLTLGPNFGTHTVSVSAAGIEGLVTFHAIAGTPEFLWSIPAGISLIHVPLKVTTVDGVAKIITSISDLYDTIGGAATVTYLMTYDHTTQDWLSYFGVSDRVTSANKELTDEMGIMANMKVPVSVRLTGNPLGTNGSSTITLNPGLNLVGLPLRDSRITRVSDLLNLDGIRGNVPVITLADGGGFKVVGRSGDPGDIPIVGGGGFILTAQQAATVAISGEGWTNTSGTAAAPPLSLKGIEVDDVTPVLALRGSIVDEDMGTSSAGCRVIVKNLSTGRAVATITKDENYSRPDKGKSTGVGYQVTVVDIETGRAAQIGDILEISVRSPSPLIGVQPLRYTVTGEDVKRSLIQLTELVAYEIPTETELLHNYPNPFNPETWIPYRLAEDAFVTLTIYDLSGHVVRALDVGHQIAAVYESRSKAIYWDGRNEFGETVASGVYFYHLSAGRSGLSAPHRRDFSATRKMLIIK